MPRARSAPARRSPSRAAPGRRAARTPCPGPRPHLLAVLLPLHAHGLSALTLPLSPTKCLGRDRPVALTAFLVGRRGAQPRRPVRPHRVALDVRRHRQQLELGDRFRAVPVGGADAVGAGVAAADDDDVLAVAHRSRTPLSPATRLVLQRQELHREVHAVELAPGHRQVARLLGAAGEHHRVELGEQLVRRDRRLRVVGDARCPVRCVPTSTPVRNSTPSARICSTRRSISHFSILKSGMP